MQKVTEQEAQCDLCDLANSKEWEAECRHNGALFSWYLVQFRDHVK